MIQRKHEEFRFDEGQCYEWPLSPSCLVKKFENETPINELYNVIYLTLYPTYKLNNFGYAITESISIANKIWSIASDWSALITGRKNAKHVMLGMRIHRLTASKEVLSVLHKAGHTVSYDDVRLQNDY